jgi:hypothetical protein
MNVTGGAPSNAQAVSGLEVIGQAILEGGDMRMEALKVLAVAASNNVLFQTTVLHYQKLLVPFLVDVRFAPDQYTLKMCFCCNICAMML